MEIKILPFASLKRCLASVLSLVYFYSNVLAVHAGEKNFWAERRTASQRMSVGGEQVSHAVESNQYLALAPLPQMGHVEFGVPQPASVGTGLSLAPNVSDIQFVSTPPSWISKLILPYGSIGEIHLSKKANAPLVIHIQDAHGIEEAQKNIASMIQGLKESQGVNLVGLEGASGAFDLDSFRGPDLSVARDLADYFLKEGKIAGPEYAGLTLQHPPVLYGVEDPPLYVNNVRALLDARKEKPAMEKTLAGLTSVVGSLKATLYSEELKEYDRLFQSYNDQKEGLADFVRYLVRVHGEDHKKFPNMGLLIKALAAEKSLDFKRVEKERLALVEMLAGGLSKTKLNLLVERSLQYRAGQMGYGDYHRFLLALCRENKIPFEKLSEMKAYIDYVLLAEQINRNALLDELTQLDRETQDRLAVTEEQKKLVSVARRLGLLSKLAAQAMTASDWTTYESQKEGVYRLASDIKNLGGQTNANVSPEFLAPFESFCLNAIQRNKAFVRNLADQIKTQKASSAILVAGGFHTQGLTGLLRENDFSYVVATPKITEVPKNDNYLDIFARDPLPLEKLFMGEKLFLKFPAPMGPEMTGVDNGPRTAFGNEALSFEGAILGKAHPKTIHESIDGINRAAGRLGLPLDLSLSGEDIIADFNGDGNPDGTLMATGPNEPDRADVANSLGTRQIGQTRVTISRPTFASRLRAFTRSPSRRSRATTVARTQNGRFVRGTSQRLRAFAAIPYDKMRSLGFTEHEWVTKIMPKRETLALAIASPILVSLLMLVGFSTLWIIALFAAMIAGLSFASIHKKLWEKNGDAVSVKNYVVWAVGGTLFALPFTFFWVGLLTGALPFIGALDFSNTHFTLVIQALVYFSSAYSLNLGSHIGINKLIQENRINNRFLMWLLEKPFAATMPEVASKEEALNYVARFRLTPFNQILMVRTGRGMYDTMGLSKAEAIQGINSDFILLQGGELRFGEGRNYQDIPAFTISDGLGNTRVVTFGDLKSKGVQVWGAPPSDGRTMGLNQLAREFLPKVNTQFNFNGTIWFFTSAEVDNANSSEDDIRFIYTFANAPSGYREYRTIRSGSAVAMTDDDVAQMKRGVFEKSIKSRLEARVRDVESFEREDNFRSEAILKELGDMKTDAIRAQHSEISTQIEGLVQRVNRAQVRHQTDREIRESFKAQVSRIAMRDLTERSLSSIENKEDLAEFEQNLHAWSDTLSKREKPEAMDPNDFETLIQTFRTQVRSIQGKVEERRGEFNKAQLAHKQRLQELDEAPAPTLVLKNLSEGEVYSHIYEKNGPLVFAIYSNGQPVYLRVRKQRSTGKFELNQMRVIVENPALNPHLLVFENVKTVNTFSPLQMIQVGNRQIRIEANKDGTHTIKLMDQGSAHGTAIVMDKRVETAEDLQLPVSLEDWHRVEALLESIGRSIADKTSPAYDRNVYVNRLAELVNSWAGLPNTLRARLIENLYLARGWTSSDQSVTQKEMLLASEWLRRFFRLYHHVFYLSPDAVLSGGQRGLVLFGRVSKYRSVGWRGFRTVTYVDPVFTNAKGGFKPMLNDDEVLVINDDLQVHQDLIALHEGQHMFDRMEYAQYGLAQVATRLTAQQEQAIDPDGQLARAGVQSWELEFTAYLKTLVRVARANQIADQVGEPRPHNFLEAVAGNKKEVLERYIQMGESREEHARALAELWDLFKIAVIVRTTYSGIQMPAFSSGQRTPEEILADIVQLEAVAPPQIMAEVAESMLNDFYMKKLGYVPQYPDVLEATIVPVSWPSPGPLWETNAGFHQYLSALESDSDRLKRYLTSLKEFNRTGRASPNQLIRIFAFLVQFPKGTIETREDLEALANQVRLLDYAFSFRIFSSHSGYENLPRYMDHIGIGHVVQQGVKDFLGAYDHYLGTFNTSLEKQAVPVPHVPLIDPVKTQIVRATHSGTEMRGRRLFTAGMGLVMGSVLALVLGEVASLSLAAVVVVAGGVFHIGLMREWNWVGSIVDGFTSVVLAGVLERPDLTTGAGRIALANRHDNPKRDRAVLLTIFRRSMGLEKVAQRRADRIARRVNALNVPSVLKPLMIAVAKTINSVGYATGVVLHVSYHSWNNLVSIAVEKKWMTTERALTLLGRRPVMAYAKSKRKENSSQTMDGTSGARGLYNLADGYPDVFSEDFIYSNKYRVIFFLARHLPTQGLRDKWLAFVLKKYEKEVPGTVGYISVRSQKIDKVVEQFASQNKNDIQLVELAAGLSARAYRLKNKIGDGPHFEFDLPASQKVKAKLLEKNQKNKPGLYPSNLVKHLSGNLAADDFMEILFQDGFDKRKPTIFILEGLTMYLTKAEVQNLFGVIKARAPPGSLVVADFLYPTEEIGTMPGGKELSDFVSKSGEPFKYGEQPDSLKGAFEKSGYDDVAILTNDSLNRVLASSGARDRLTMAQFFYMVTMRVPGGTKTTTRDTGEEGNKERDGNNRVGVLAPNGLPQAVGLAELSTLVGDSRPINLDPRFRGNLGPAVPDTQWAAMAGYLGDLNVKGDGDQGAAVVKSTGGEILTSEFARTLQSSNANDIASYLLSLVKEMAGLAKSRTSQSLNNLVAGVALLHAKGLALLAQANNGEVPTRLADLREAQAQDIHLLVQVAALIGVTEAEDLNTLFLRHYDETMKKAETLARLEAKGVEDARGDTGTFLTVNLNGLEEADVPGAIAYIVGAAKARKKIQGAAPVAVTSLLTIQQLTAMNPALRAVASQVVAVTPSQAQELYLEGRLSVKALVLYIRSQKKNVISLDVVSPGEGTVLEDQGPGVDVTVRDYFSMIRAIADEIKGMVFILLQA